MKITQFLITLLILASLVFTTTGCDKAKALKTVRDAENLAANMLIYGRNIARANNEGFRAGNISPEVHLATNKLADVYLKGLDAYVRGIAIAKNVISEGGDASNQLDILERLFNAEVVQSALALINSVATLPPAIAEKLAGWAAAIQLALVSFRALIAEAHGLTNAEVSHAG